jgi:hypothetical protein
MSNYHLKSKNLGLKAVGLFSKILMLPDEWDYTVEGLTKICKESKTTVNTALAELKEWGYCKVTKLMPNETESGRIEYIYDFFEYSEKDEYFGMSKGKDSSGNSEKSNKKNGKSAGAEKKNKKKSNHEEQEAEKQDIESLGLESLGLEIQELESMPQINTNISNTKKSNTYVSNTQSINQSYSGNSPEEKFENDGWIDRYAREQQIYTEVVKSNIGYDDYIDWIKYFGEGNIKISELDEIVEMIVRAICSPKKSERICGQDFPREVIKSAMLKVDRTCLDNAVDVMRETDDIRNFEKYLISTLFNEANGRHFKENSTERNAEYAVKRDFAVY